ncbi:MAG: lysine--tRNA ligase, partial [Quisquiliibacterium sp.]
MTEPTEPLDQNQILAERRAKLLALRQVGPPFPNDYEPSNRAQALIDAHGGQSREELESAGI